MGTRSQFAQTRQVPGNSYARHIENAQGRRNTNCRAGPSLCRYREHHPANSGHPSHTAGRQAQIWARRARPREPLVPVQPKAASPRKEVTAARPLQLGAAILAARTAAGLSQNELASRTKTAQPNIGRLEKGGSLPSVRTLQRIAKATGHKLVISFVPIT